MRIPLLFNNSNQHGRPAFCPLLPPRLHRLERPAAPHLPHALGMCGPYGGLLTQLRLEHCPGGAEGRTVGWRRSGLGAHTKHNNCSSDGTCARGHGSSGCHQQRRVGRQLGSAVAGPAGTAALCGAACGVCAAGSPRANTPASAAAVAGAAPAYSSAPGGAAHPLLACAPAPGGSCCLRSKPALHI